MNITILSQDTINLVTKYCLGEIEGFHDPILNNLILSYLDDSNSSTLREAVTSNICGYKWSSDKLGYDALNESTDRHVEIKPKRYSSGLFNGGGNFTDLTPERFSRIKKDNPAMICSFFVYGRLGYIFEFDFADIADAIWENVYTKCVVDRNQYARSSTFNYAHWINSPNLKKHYINLPLLTSKKCLNKKFFTQLDLKYGNHRSVFEFAA